ncbi:unnamed protein product [Brassicogethes aeneus]|uniref:Uncharacterized protein n=1 Tax=Brassicogethes aeneus TaxID=1431903 RepID=A0A9P0FIA7_BRAAE|nr:unnamed protein product [Brassicogethes aeneus]
MKQIIFLLALFGFISCDVLNNRYLPPPNNDGYSNDLTPPKETYSTNGVSTSNGHEQNQNLITNNFYTRNSFNNRVPQAQILESGDGKYKYSYKTAHGTSVHEQGIGGVQAIGGFSFQSPDGKNYQLTYVADENGFRPQGAHLPTPPPIPDYILRSLEYNKQHALRHGSQDGQYIHKNIHRGGYKYQSVAPQSHYLPAKPQIASINTSGGQYYQKNIHRGGYKYEPVAPNRQYLPSRVPQNKLALPQTTSSSKTSSEPLYKPVLPQRSYLLSKSAAPNRAYLPSKSEVSSYTALTISKELPSTPINLEVPQRSYLPSKPAVPKGHYNQKNIYRGDYKYEPSAFNRQYLRSKPQNTSVLDTHSTSTISLELPITTIKPVMPQRSYLPSKPTVPNVAYLPSKPEVAKKSFRPTTWIPQSRVQPKRTYLPSKAAVSKKTFSPNRSYLPATVKPVVQNRQYLPPRRVSRKFVSKRKLAA